MQSTQADTSDLYEGMSSWTVISDNLATMENLALSCRSGKICCFRVIVAYKICQVSLLLQTCYDLQFEGQQGRGQQVLAIKLSNCNKSVDNL